MPPVSIRGVQYRCRTPSLKTGSWMKLAARTPYCNSPSIKTGCLGSILDMSSLDTCHVQYWYWTYQTSSIDTGCPVLIPDVWYLHCQNKRRHPTDSGVSQSGSPGIVTGGIFRNHISIWGSRYPVLRLDGPVSRLGQLQYGIQHVWLIHQIIINCLMKKFLNYWISKIHKLLLNDVIE